MFQNWHSQVFLSACCSGCCRLAPLVILRSPSVLQDRLRDEESNSSKLGVDSSAAKAIFRRTKLKFFTLFSNSLCCRQESLAKDENIPAQKNAGKTGSIQVFDILQHLAFYWACNDSNVLFSFKHYLRESLIMLLKISQID